MNRHIFLLLLLGAATFSGIGCTSRVQKQLQRQQAFFVQEYRLLEDELFQAYQELDYLERTNEGLRNQLEPGSKKESSTRASRTSPQYHPPRNAPNYAPAMPNGNGNDESDIEPISTEGIEPSSELPQVLQNRTSQRNRANFRTNETYIYPLPQIVEPQPRYSNFPAWSPFR